MNQKIALGVQLPQCIFHRRCLSITIPSGAPTDWMSLLLAFGSFAQPTAGVRQGSSSVVFPKRIRAYLIRVYARTLEVFAFL